MEGNRKEEKMKTKVYVAGPYTSPDSCINTHNAIEMGDRLLEAGYVPFVPHLTHFWHTMSPKDYQTWLDYDEQWMVMCDVMIRLPGKSSGADREEAIFRKLGKPVFRDLSRLIKVIPSSRE